MTMTLRKAAALLTLTGFLALGCSQAPQAGDDLTQITVALMTVPSDVLCVEITVNASTTVTKRVDVTPGAAALITITGVPIGPATIDEKAYNVACSAVVPGVTQPTWVAAMPVSVTLAAGQTTDVALVLKRPPQIRISNDFQDSPVLTATPAPIVFGTATTGGAALTQAVTVSNTGTVAAPFNAAITGSDAAHFSVTTSGCPATGALMSVGASCTVTVRFAPTIAGPKTAYLALGMPAALLVPVSGDAITIQLSASPASLNFGSVFLSTTTAGQVVTLSNTGTVPVSFTSAFAGTNPTLFTLSASTCPAMIAVGASCQLTITHTGSAPLGAKSASLNIGAPTILSIPLASTVVTPVSVTPASLTFATATINTSAPNLSVTVNNISTVSINTAGALTGTDAAQFSIVTACPATLAAGASCTATLKFTPTSPGAKSAALSFGTPTIVGTVNLTGTGATAVISAAPASVSFGTVLVGAPSAQQMVTITNTGPAPVPFGTSLAGPDAAQIATPLNNCPQGGAMLNNGASCMMTLVLTPTTAGMKSATLSLGLPVVTTVTLTGTAATPVVTLNPTVLNFGSVTVNGPPPTQVVSVVNTGSVDAAIAPTFSGTDSASFSLAGSTCPPTLLVGANCALTIRAAVTTAGAKSAALNLGTAGSIPLLATGVATPSVSTFPALLDFGAVAPASMPVSQTVRVVNSSASPVTIATSFNGTDAALFTVESTTCTGTLSPNTSCTVTVRLTPSASGTKSAMLAFGTVASVQLAANIVGPATVTVSPTMFNFASVLAGTLNGPMMSINITNASASARPVPLFITGADPGQFVLMSTTCPVGAGTLAAGASCQAMVRFAPATAGAKAATLAVGSPIAAFATLAGTGN
jgi:hypothetical protein